MRTNVHGQQGTTRRALLHTTVMIGALVGIALTVTFSAWLYVANRVPSLENFALVRNLIGASVLGAFALIPVVRFVRSPRYILISSLIAWTILTLAYAALGVYFTALNDEHSTSQVFILGAVSYMILATLAWVGTFIWRARASHSS